MELIFRSELLLIVLCMLFDHHFGVSNSNNYGLEKNNANGKDVSLLKSPDDAI